MKIALCQINPTVGDIAGNAAKVRDNLRRAADAGARLAIFPELVIIGYPPKDLLLKPAVLVECEDALADLAAECRTLTAVIGYPCPSDKPDGRALYNAAAVCTGGRVVHRHYKSLLPTYDVFDELRYFEPGPPVDLTHVDGLPLGISICEDLWNEKGVVSRQLYHDNPMDELARLGARLFVNCSASPFVIRKHEFRLKLMSSVARRLGLPIAYCNQVGGNDELVFDGNSCVIDAAGRVVAHAKGFEEDLLLADVAGEGMRGEGLGPGRHDRGSNSARPSALGPSPSCHLADAYHALVLGLRDYCGKCGFKSIVIGLSGGIDSALTAALAVAAVGAEHVRGVAMPSRYSSQGSVDDAAELARRLGIAFHVVPIEEPHAAMESLLVPHFEGRPADTTEENVQARIRGVILMAFSNKFGSLLVTTGNKSELAVGYCTLYGDMAGGLAVLSDVPKTMVWDLARWINTPPCPLHAQFGGPVIPESSISKVPSAELRPNQTDQDSLPPYDVLDDIIERYVEREHAAPRIIADTGLDADLVLRVVRMIDLNEYKRKQAAPGLKITGRAFGFGRRMPIAQRYDNRRALQLSLAKASS